MRIASNILSDLLVKSAVANADFVTLECARNIAQAQFDLGQIQRIKVALLSSVMALAQTQDGLQIKRDDAERVQSQEAPLPEGAADATQEALFELIKIDRYERRAAARRSRAVRILLERKKA